MADGGKSVPQGTEATLVDPRRLEDMLRDAQRGLIASIGQFTVTVSATTTTVTHYGISSNSWVMLMPTNSTAAAEYVLGTTYVTPAKGQFVVTHPSNTNTRTYRYVFFSGIRQ